MPLVNWHPERFNLTLFPTGSCACKTTRQKFQFSHPQLLPIFFSFPTYPSLVCTLWVWNTALKAFQQHRLWLIDLKYGICNNPKAANPKSPGFRIFDAGEKNTTFWRFWRISPVSMDFFLLMLLMGFYFCYLASEFKILWKPFYMHFEFVFLFWVTPIVLLAFYTFVCFCIPTPLKPPMWNLV